MTVQGRCEERFARVRAVFEQSFEAGEVGAGIAVTIDGEAVVDLWGGFADEARTRSWQRDTIAYVASTTKGPTAACLHQLSDRGRVDLDAPVARYWPEFAQAGKQDVPVHMLLSHRVGLPALRQDLPRGADCEWSRMVQALAAERPWWEPGTQHGYHALSFGFLVGEVVRRVDGRSLGRYWREEFATPLGLDFQIGLNDAELTRCAEMIPLPRDSDRNPLLKLTKTRDSALARAFTNPPTSAQAINSETTRRAEIPASNGHGTAAAVSRFYGALARGGELDGVRVLSPEAIERATREQASGPDAVVLGMPMRFGLGFMLTHKLVRLGRGERSFGHPGMGGSIGFADPDARLGFGYVMNRMQQGFVGDARGFALIRAVYDSLKH
jgi:CubicO group peptidase (beta-lactamase class C family)